MLETKTRSSFVNKSKNLDAHALEQVRGVFLQGEEKLKM